MYRVAAQLVAEVCSLWRERGAAIPVVAYSGAVHQQIIEDLADIVERLSSSPPVARRLLLTFVELAQNVARYSAVRSEATGGEVGWGLLVVEETARGWDLLAGNPIAHDRAEVLAERLRYLNGLGPPALHDYYLLRRAAHAAPGDKGAGLGLVEIIRRTGHPLLLQNWPARKWPMTQLPPQTSPVEGEFILLRARVDRPEDPHATHRSTPATCTWGTDLVSATPQS